MNKGSPKRTGDGAESSKQKASRPKRKVASQGKHSAIDNPHSELKQQPIASQQTPGKTMEVHHHPQLEHNPKPWKEYLLEGFMIFVAVMMGFIAENIREGINNREHVKELTAQLVRDLKADTAQLNLQYRLEQDYFKSNDTLFNMLQQPIATIDLKKLQLLVTNAHTIFLFHPSMGAINAIKNEIHLKQFSNSKMIGFIENYERHLELMHTIQDILMQYQRLYLDSFLRTHFIPANLDAAFGFSNKPTPTSQMRNLTQADLTQLAADMVLVKISLREQLRDDNYIKKDAEEMLKYVKQQYDPEE